MQKQFRFVMVLALVCLAAAPAFAADKKFGAEVFGAFNSYSMSDVNDGLKNFNENAGTNFDDVTSGLTGGINARMWANQNWLFSAGWEPLFLSTESKTDAASTSGKINLDGNSFQFTGAYMFPSHSNGRYGIGAGLGYYSISGEGTGVAGDNGSTVDISGSTVGFHFMGMGEWTVSPGFAITAASGYRIAKISDTKFNDESQSPELETDYSGFMGRVGLSFYLPTSTKQ